jgi:hypothetical protein
MKQLFITIILFISMTSLMAQKFERSAGIRFGNTNGIFFDIQNKDLSSYRFMVSWRESGRQLTAMKFFHRYKVDKLPRYLSFYYGYGVHAGYTEWNQNKRDKEHGYYWEKVSAPVAGLDAIIGLSYDFERIPVSITGDVKPFFDFWGRKVFKAVPFDFAVSAIYHF